MPATKGPEAPAGLPEALYYKVEGVEGRLGIEQISQLSPGTKILVRREKGSSDDKEKQYVPASFTAVIGKEGELPKTDFATVIVGRSGGADAPDEVWTVHPGAPIRPFMKDFDFTRGLKSPQETAEGEKQGALLLTVEEVLSQTDLKPDDYVKLTQSDESEMHQKYEIKK